MIPFSLYRNATMLRRGVPRLDVPCVEHEGVLPVLCAAATWRRCHRSGGPPRAVPAGLPDGTGALVVPEHG